MAVYARVRLSILFEERFDHEDKQADDEHLNFENRSADRHHFGMK